MWVLKNLASLLFYIYSYDKTCLDYARSSGMHPSHIMRPHCMSIHTYQQLWVCVWVVVRNVADIIWMWESNFECSCKIWTWFVGWWVLVAVPVVADVSTHTNPSWTPQNSLMDRVHDWFHTCKVQKNTISKLLMHNATGNSLQISFTLTCWLVTLQMMKN
jgi:hypothetical protein